MFRKDTFQKRIRFYLYKMEEGRSPYLELIWRPWWPLVRRALRFSGLVTFRGLIHLARFLLISELIPGFNLSDLAQWILGVGIVEAAAYGSMEEIRERARDLGDQKFKEALILTRIWNRRFFYLLVFIWVCFFVKYLLPIISTDRVFSIFDAIRIFFIIRFSWNTILLPESALIQGKSRLHLSSVFLYGPEIFSFIGLPILFYFFGIWGISFHYLWEALIKEGSRTWILRKTRNDLGIAHRWLRWPKSNLPLIKTSGKTWIFIIFQMMTRVEAWALPVFWHYGGGLSLVFFLPWIRSLVDFGKIFQFDLLRKRFRIDHFVSYSTLKRVSFLSIPYGMVILLSLELISKIILGEWLSSLEVLIMIASAGIGVFQFLLVYLFWSFSRKKKNHKKLSLIHYQTIRGADATEFRQVLGQRFERYGISELCAFGNRGMLIACADPIYTRSELNRVAPGLENFWKPILEFPVITKSAKSDWKMYWETYSKVKVSKSISRLIFTQHPNILKTMVERGENGVKTPDRKFRIFWDPTNKEYLKWMIIPQSIYMGIEDRENFKKSAVILAQIYLIGDYIDDGIIIKLT